MFGATENSELIGEDGQDLKLICRKLQTQITKTGISSTLGLQDLDLVNLAREILNLWMLIKMNQGNKHCLVLQDRCRDIKVDRIVMNELMYKLIGY